MANCDITKLLIVDIDQCIKDLKCTVIGSGSSGKVVKDVDSGCILKNIKKDKPTDELNNELRDCKVGYRTVSYDTKNGTIGAFNDDGINLKNVFTDTQKENNLKKFLDHINVFVQIVSQLECTYKKNIAYFDLKMENIVLKTVDTPDINYAIYDGSKIIKYAKATIIDIDGFVKMKNPYQVSTENLFISPDSRNLPIEFYTGMLIENNKVITEIGAPLLVGLIDIFMFFFDMKINIRDFFTETKNVNIKKIIDLIENLIINTTYREFFVNILVLCLDYPNDLSLSKILFNLNEMKNKYTFRTRNAGVY